MKQNLRLEWIEAGSLAENPHNWRRHPEGQMAALKDVLADEEIGWAGACLFNERTGRLIDGHARRNAVDPSTPIPVLVGDWSEAAEKKILLTLDPLAGLATPDPEQLRALLDEVSLDTDALKALGEGLVGLLSTNSWEAPVPDFQPVGADEQGRLDQKAPTICPKCGHEFTT
jgi:ParB family chromosome partitioning protein